MADLVHFSALPICRPIETRLQQSHPDAKPAGFWFSVESNGDGWKDWCESEQWRLDGLACAHAIDLSAEARILRLEGAGALDLFHAEFRWDGGGEDWRSDYINWAEVARRWQGIIIAPYVWARRLNTPVHRWYYGWDCASGCIWDASAIERLTLIEEKQNA